ncbi:MAG: PD-(D/E)XK nuclease family protein [Gammaproteobacteria bacterium]|nr:PD-(D/E)XK nuclease family protein [Gammaproteobacteria bacterium]
MPSARLARHYRLRYAQAREAEGQSAWNAPDIIAWDHWLARLWQRGPATRALLGPMVATRRWEALVSDEGGLTADIARTAVLAREALRLLRQWQLPVPALREGGTQDSRRFAEWLQMHEAGCSARQELDPLDLASAVLQALRAGSIPVPSRQLWLGFTALTPLACAIAEVCRAAGARLIMHPGGEHAGERQVFAAADAPHELACAATWLARELEHETADVGLVVPDLASRRDEVESTLIRLLAPGSADAAEAGINFSVGRALADEPVIESARLLLAGLVAPLDFGSASLVLRSPHIAASAEERGARARLERQLRELNLSGVRLAGLQAHAAAGQCPTLATALSQLLAERASWPARAGAAQWGVLLDAALRAGGWPGESAPHSRVFQALQRWRETLGELAAEDAALGQLDFRAYLSVLLRQLRERQFQPQLPAGRLEVIGTLEAAGREYTALWITGLTAERWPPPLRPHPLLPVALQRRAGLPQADPAAGLAHAQALMGALCAAAPSVVMSWPQRSDGAEGTASPLLQGAPLADGLEARGHWAAAMLSARPTLVVAADPAPALLADESRAFPVGLLELQQRCPLAAFARHRLHARPLESPVPALSALLRGSLVHRLLELFWQRHGSDQRWREFPDDVLAAEVRACATGAAAELLPTEDAFARAVVAVEIQRQCGLVLLLLAQEKLRPAFIVEHLEYRVSLTLGDIRLSGRADRIDRLDAGNTLLIDYKSGQPRHTGLVPPRLDAPQLPAYALVLGEEVAGMGFVSLRSDRVGFFGVGSEAMTTPGSWRSWRVLSHQEWAELMATWRAEITALAEAFAAGDARLNLDDVQAAAGDYAVFTRIHEIPAVMEPSDGYA